MDTVYEEEEVQELDLEKDLCFEEEQPEQPQVSVEEIRANSRFLTEESCGTRAPRFSNPTIERLNSFRYRKPGSGSPNPQEERADPRAVYQNSYDAVETRQRTAPPQFALRRGGSNRSAEQLLPKPPSFVAKPNPEQNRRNGDIDVEVRATPVVPPPSVPHTSPTPAAKEGTGRSGGRRAPAAHRSPAPAPATATARSPAPPALIATSSAQREFLARAAERRQPAPFSSSTVSTATTVVEKKAPAVDRNGANAGAASRHAPPAAAKMTAPPAVKADQPPVEPPAAPPAIVRVEEMAPVAAESSVATVEEVAAPEEGEPVAQAEVINVDDSADVELPVAEDAAPTQDVDDEPTPEQQVDESAAPMEYAVEEPAPAAWYPAEGVHEEVYEEVYEEQRRAPATEFIPTRSPAPMRRARSNPRPSTASIPPGMVKIPFSNSSRVATSIELMSPIRQRNALEALEASIMAHAEDPLPLAQTAGGHSRSATPTSLRRPRHASSGSSIAADTRSESRSSTGGWNSNVKVHYPSANEIAIEHIQLIKMDSGEKPLPPRPRTYATSRSSTPTGSRSATPTSRLTRRSLDDVSVLSGASSQGRGGSKSPVRNNRSASSLLSPYNLMVADRPLDVAKLAENDLKTIGKQLLLLKLLLESKMASDAEQEEQDLLHAWQTVRDAEEQARTLAGEDLSAEEVTRVHQHVSEMEHLVDKVTDHLAPVFDRLSTYIKLKEDEERGINGAVADPGDVSAHESKVQTHKELQTRLTVLSKCLAIMKKNVENPELAVVPRVGGPAAGDANARQSRRQSLNSHVTASAAARRSEAAAERAQTTQAADKHSPPPQPKPKPARHSLGATPTRSTSPAAIKSERRLSLNSHVTASAAARRSEAQAAQEKAAAAKSPKPAAMRPLPRVALLAAKPRESVDASDSSSKADPSQRRLSLNSNLTASQAARRAEIKEVKGTPNGTPKVDAKARARSPHVTPKLPAPFSSPPAAATRAVSADKSQRRVSLNSHLTASQQARRTEIKQAQQSPNKETPSKSPPKARSPHATVNHAGPFFGAKAADSEQPSPRNESPDAAQRRLSLNSQLTASQKARRAEAEQERLAAAAAVSANTARSPAITTTSPKGSATPPASLTRTSSRGRMCAGTDGSADTTGADVEQRRLSLNSNLTASQAARRADIKSEQAQRTARSPGQTQSSKGLATTPSFHTTTETPERTVTDPPAKEVMSVGQPGNTRTLSDRQPSLSKMGLFADVDDELPTEARSEDQQEAETQSGTVDVVEQGPEAPADTADAEADVAVGAATLDSSDRLNADEAADIDEADEAIAPQPVDVVVAEASTTETVAEPPALSATDATQAVPDIPAVVPSDNTVEEQLDGMFSTGIHSDDAQDTVSPEPGPAADTPVTAQVPSMVADTIPQPASTEEETNTAAAGSTEMMSPERKARREAFERLMKRMNSNKEATSSADASSSIPAPAPAPTPAPAPAPVAVPITVPAPPAAATQSDDAKPAITSTESSYGDVFPYTESDAAAEGQSAAEPDVQPALSIDTAAPASEATEDSPKTDAAAVDTKEEASAPRGVSALLSKFELKASAPKMDTPGRPGSELSPLRREKSVRVSELMSKFSKKDVTSPVPAEPESRNVRASVRVLGDITPIKAVFEKHGADDHSEPVVSTAFSTSDEAAVGDIPSAEGPSGAEPTASTAADGQPETQQEEEPASAEATKKVTTPEEAPQREPAEDTVAQSRVLEPVAEADEAAVESESQTVSAAVEPTNEEQPLVEEAAEQTAAAEVPVTESEPPAVDYSPATNTVEGSAKEEQALEPESDTKPVPESDAIPEPEPAVDPVAEPVVEQVAAPSEVESPAPARSVLEAIPESEEVEQVEQLEQPGQPEQPSPAYDTDNAAAFAAAADAVSDAGTETSSKKGGRATFKGLWKRVKSVTAKKDSPFESEGWKPSPMSVPEDSEYDGANDRPRAFSQHDQGADWSTPDVFDDSQDNSQQGGSVRSALTHDDGDSSSIASSTTKKKATLKGLWKMVKASK